MINQENESYSVAKFMMVTCKHLGNVIVCDDKASVSLVDPKTMSKIATIPPPTDNCYLYSVYKHELSNTIYLGFDDKKMIGIDSNRYNNKSLMPLDVAILQFTEFHADPANYVILACEYGKIKILQPSRNMIVASFDIELAIKDYQKEQNNNEELDLSQP